MVFIPHESNISVLNWKIFSLYSTGRIDECKQLIETILHQSRGLSEFSLFMKATLTREEGEIQESLELFQALFTLHGRKDGGLLSKHFLYLHNIAKCLHLLGQFEEALVMYRTLSDSLGQSSSSPSSAVNPAAATGQCRELWHNLGLCYEGLSQDSEALQAFEMANSIRRSDGTFLSLSRVNSKMNDPRKAIEILQEALAVSPNNSAVLYELGCLYLSQLEFTDAFSALGSAISSEPSHHNAVASAAAIIHCAHDFEVAKDKYRRCLGGGLSLSPRLWCNIGMCFYSSPSSTLCLESLVSLRRAHYMDPFDWRISFNLGLLSLKNQTYASAFHYFQASLQIENKYALTLSFMALSLAYMQDYTQSLRFFKKALTLVDKVGRCVDASRYCVHFSGVLNEGVQAPQHQSQLAPPAANKERDETTTETLTATGEHSATDLNHPSSRLDRDFTEMVVRFNFLLCLILQTKECWMEADDDGFEDERSPMEDCPTSGMVREQLLPLKELCSNLPTNVVECYFPGLSPQVTKLTELCRTMFGV